MQWWSLIDDCLDKNAFPNHFLQLATVREDGSPAVRTIVYRGRNEHHHLLMISDARSEKFAQIMAHPKAEANWYFYDTREQFRISGDIHCILPSDQDPIIQSLWRDLSHQAKQQYLWPNPGIPIHNDNDFSGIPIDSEEDDLSEPPMHFCVLQLMPIKVDYLKLSQPMHEHLRFNYDLVTRQWQQTLLTP